MRFLWNSITASIAFVFCPLHIRDSVPALVAHYCSVCKSGPIHHLRSDGQNKHHTSYWILLAIWSAADGFCSRSVLVLSAQAATMECHQAASNGSRFEGIVSRRWRDLIMDMVAANIMCVMSSAHRLMDRTWQTLITSEWPKRSTVPEGDAVAAVAVA